MCSQQQENILAQRINNWFARVNFYSIVIRTLELLSFLIKIKEHVSLEDFLSVPGIIKLSLMLLHGSWLTKEHVSSLLVLVLDETSRNCPILSAV